MSKPKVIVDCVANHYTSDNERIIEFNSDAGGGLISFQLITNDDYTHKLIVDVYNTDRNVEVHK